MIDAILRGSVARFWRWRIKRREAQRTTWTADFMEWKRENPGRCMYCAHTHWASTEQHMKMPLENHFCVEGNSPPCPLPEARIR